MVDSRTWQQPTPWHREVFSVRAGDAVVVRCRCRIGLDHTYDDWLGLPENQSKLARAVKVRAVVPLRHDG